MVEPCRHRRHLNFVVLGAIDVVSRTAAARQGAAQPTVVLGLRVPVGEFLPAAFAHGRTVGGVLL